MTPEMENNIGTGVVSLVIVTVVRFYALYAIVNYAVLLSLKKSLQRQVECQFALLRQLV